MPAAQREHAFRPHPEAIANKGGAFPGAIPPLRLGRCWSAPGRPCPGGEREWAGRCQAIRGSSKGPSVGPFAPAAPGEGQGAAPRSSIHVRSRRGPSFGNVHPWQSLFAKCPANVLQMFCKCSTNVLGASSRQSAPKTFAKLLVGGRIICIIAKKIAKYLQRKQFILGQGKYFCPGANVLQMFGPSDPLLNNCKTFARLQKYLPQGKNDCSTPK